MAISWQIQTEKKHGLVATVKNKYPYKEARLSDAKGDLTKQWVVEYYVWSEQQEKMVRKRVVINEPTAQLRYKLAEKVIKEVNGLLKSGVLTDPLQAPVLEAKKTELSPTLSIFEATDHFLLVKSTTLSKQTKRTYKSCVNVFKDYLNDKKLKHLKLVRFDTTQAFAYLDFIKADRKLGNRGHNKHRGFMVGLFNFYIKRKIITENPFTDTDKLKTRSGKHLPFRHEQIEQVKQYLKDNPDPQFWLFINCIYFLFARPHEELRLMRVRDIQKKTIVVQPDTAKVGRTSHRLIAPDLEIMLRLHEIRNYPPEYYLFSRSGTPDRDPVGESYFYDRHRKMLQYLGFPPGYDLYGWKHTGVIQLYIATKDMKLIQRQCGHSTIEQTDEYLRDLGMLLDYDELSDFPSL